MDERIIVGFDDSEESRHAVRWAVDYARTRQGTLELVSVARPPEVGADVETEHVIQRMQQRLSEALQAQRSTIDLPPERVQASVLVGHPAESLLRHADERDAGLIVVGHRSRRAVRQWLVGSVARQVIDHARCPVVVVR